MLPCGTSATVDCLPLKMTLKGIVSFFSVSFFYWFMFVRFSLPILMEITPLYLDPSEIAEIF